jgi:tetratricopeptide (TPR) repeat protein
MLSPESKSRTEPKPRFVDQLSDFLHKYRVVLLVILIILVVFVVAYFTYTEWHKHRREQSTVMAERAQNLYTQWVQAEDRQSLEQQLQDLIGRIVERYPRQYAAQRARFIRANMAFEKEQWGQAAEYYRNLAKSFSQSYLAPIGLFNAGVAFEKAEDVEQAMASYQQVVDGYPDNFLVPHALFSLGRLYESREDFENAFQLYNRLEDEHPLSNWTKLGRNRIIDLKVQGRIAE